MSNFNNKNVDIPDFVEDKDKDTDSVDMSIFKMSEEELYDDVPKKEVKKTGKKKSNATLVLCLIAIVILLATSIIGIVYATKEHNACVEATDKASQLVASNNELNTKVNELTNTVNTLNAKIAELETNGNKADSNNKYAAGTKLYITEEGGSQGVRTKASVDAENATKNGADYVLYWGDAVTLTEAATVDSAGNYWGKIDGGFIRIEYNGEIWASTEQQ